MMDFVFERLHVPHFDRILRRRFSKRIVTGVDMKGRHSAGRSLGLAALLLAPLLTLSLAEPAAARAHRHSSHHAAYHRATRQTWHRPVTRAVRRPVYRAATWGSPTDPAKDAELVIDGKTGRVLFARNAEAQRHPASLTKMMTLYMLFDALKRGQVTLNSPVYISQHAAWQPPTKLGLRPGDSLPVDMAIRAAVVLSANDIAVAIAEALGGTESHFAEMMNQKAHDLGMRNTFYHNASGLPDNRQITTASDLGLLAHHLAYDFPQYFHYFSLPGFSFRGRVHLGHDNLLGRYAGADGIKTGYTNASGFNLVSSVVRGGAHIIGVVMGGYSAHRRDMEMMRILDWTFAQINAQPTLVARAAVPWQTIAQNANPSPTIAGFQFGSGATGQPQQPMQQYASLAPNEMDEDSAESRPDDDEIGKIIANGPPQPQIGARLVPQAQAPAPQQARTNMVPQPKPQANVAMITAPAQAKFPPPKAQAAQAAAQAAPPIAAANIPAIVPTPRDNAVPLALASIQAQSSPDITPIPRDAGIQAAMLRPTLNTPAPGFGMVSTGKAAATAVTGHGWTVQIGAFNDVPSARAELAAYAEKSTPKLGRAERIVVPYTGSDGKMMYRARFGTFAEQEARSICVALTHQGHSCFASTLAR
jgi:D-alanyl-D-alanine carboxypeptidase